MSNLYKWTEIAFRLLNEKDLDGEVISVEGVIRSRVWGQCPCCGHEIDERQTHTAVANLMGTERFRGAAPDLVATAAEPRYFEVDVSCRCQVPHPGAPADTRGCGVSFRVELPLQANH